MGMSVLRNEKGFTILEAVFAAGILAFAILSYTILKTSSRHSQVFSRDLSQAIQLSMSQMDAFAMLDHNDPLLAATAGTAHQYSELGVLQIGDFALDDATWTVVDNSPCQKNKLVTFTSQWNLPGNPKTFTITKVILTP
jgi:type II secretory pathway pseudopilin PulG